MFYIPHGCTRPRRIPPNPIYDIETVRYYNKYYRFITENNIVAFFAIELYEYTPEYKEEFHETTVRVWLPTHTFSFVHKEKYVRQPQWLGS